jgi:hypoxanthine-DNA glycosylase
MTEVLTAFAPLVSKRTRLVILGSFPGVASLKAQQYYGHPQNQFWRIFEAIWPLCRSASGLNSYQTRSATLLEAGLGLWDIYASCERAGSLDSQIRQPVLNDLQSLRQLCPQLQAIAHNGAESFKHAKHSSALGVPVYRLPSTSPANASWTFERKLAAWREVFDKHGLDSD